LTLLDTISLVYTVDCYFPDTEADCDKSETTINETNPDTTEVLETNQTEPHEPTKIPNKRNQTEVDVETEMENSPQVVDEEVKNPYKTWIAVVFDDDKSSAVLPPAVVLKNGHMRNLCMNGEDEVSLKYEEIWYTAKILFQAGEFLK
jgi:hypothetical protein